MSFSFLKDSSDTFLKVKTFLASSSAWRSAARLSFPSASQPDCHKITKFLEAAQHSRASHGQFVTSETGLYFKKAILLRDALNLGNLEAGFKVLNTNFSPGAKSFCMNISAGADGFMDVILRAPADMFGF